MTTFIQIHMLTHYHPSNLNRDDLGRPKTALMGGQQRLRVSSQSLKRAWRTSERFRELLDGRLGTRTKRFGQLVYDRMVAGGMKEKAAEKRAGLIAAQFGKTQKKKPLEIEQLVHLSQHEQEQVWALVETLIAEDRDPTEAELVLLREEHASVDIALFGRMVASEPRFNFEAAAQVAHAVTTHPARVEDDYFSAVDDLNRGDEDAGAGHIGQTEFGAGVFYLYICVDRDLLVRNLDGDEALAGRAIAALVEAAATIAPTGKQNSFGSRARASYVMVERGTQQPRSLATAFVAPLPRELDQMTASIKALDQLRDAMDAAYGACADARATMQVGGEGSLADIKTFVQEA